MAGKHTNNTHSQAARLYQSVHQTDSARCGDLAYYSTCLWYTQREVELSALAHEMLEANKGSPEVMAAVQVFYFSRPLAVHHHREGLLQLRAIILE